MYMWVHVCLHASPDNEVKNEISGMAGKNAGLMKPNNVLLTDIYTFMNTSGFRLETEQRLASTPSLTEDFMNLDVLNHILHVAFQR